MRYIATFVLVFLSFGLALNAQESVNREFPYEIFFREAYEANPGIPKGILEAVAYDRTHIRHIRSENDPTACTGMPLPIGVMGLIEDSKGVFNNTLSLIAQLSGYSIPAIKADPRINILSYAAAYSALLRDATPDSTSFDTHIRILKALSELPATAGISGQYPQDAQLYSLLTFLQNKAYQQLFQFPAYSFNLSDIFGEDNLKVLSANKVYFDGKAYQNETGIIYRSPPPCYDAPGVLWVSSPNYSSRAGTAISAVTVHTTQGSYAGAISWFQNTASQVSAHYVIRSSDGQVTQMVCEADKAWHVGNENPYTIGIEHEGFIADASWYTTAMYNASAAIVRDIINAGYGINPLRTYHGPGCTGSTATCGLGACTKIKGHQQFPNQTHTDPGQYWNWDLYYNLINNNPTITIQTSATGTVYDSGGNSGNYGNDERQVIRIAPTGASTISLTINSFNTELNYDYLYIYDGPSYSSSLIGRFSGTTIPATINASGNSLLLDFRTDCSTIGAGFSISWNATVPDITAPTTNTTVPTWVTADFTANFTDSDNAGGSGVNKRFYQVSDYDGSRWSANSARGFMEDAFSGTTLHPMWTTASGNWALATGALLQSDEANSNTNIYAPLTQNLSNIYLYHWKGKISGTGTNKRAGLHFFCNAPASPNRGVSYFVYFRDDNNNVQIYEVDATDTYTLVKEEAFNINTNQNYDYKILYDRTNGDIKVYINNVLAAAWTDPSPIQNGSYVSFRSGNCQWTIDDFRVYRSRTTSSVITAGNASADIRYQNTGPNANAGQIRSIISDVAGNFSAVTTTPVKTDWTPPSAPVISSESITFNAGTQQYSLLLNWANANDTHSAISGYSIKIGTTPGGDNLLPLTPLGNVNSVTNSNLSLISGTTYYQSLMAINGAGLMSTESGSTGVTAGCAAPANLHETNLTPTGVKLNWTAVSDKKNYQVRIRPLGGTYLNYRTTPNNKTLSWLIPGTTYEWSVRTRCQLAGVWTSYSPTKIFTTPVSALTGIENSSETAVEVSNYTFDMTIVPNPVRGNYTEIRLSEAVASAEMTVYGIDGQIFHQQQVSGEVILLDCDHFPPGIYIVTLMLNHHIYAGKLVK